MRVALIHNILPPYRVGLFEEVSRHLGVPNFKVILARYTHSKRRKWDVRTNSHTFQSEVLRTFSLSTQLRSVDFSFGVSQALSSFSPAVVVVAGWDLPASWSAIRWATRQNVPVVAWIESWHESGKHRGWLSDSIRRYFLSAASTVLVPGLRAEEYVNELMGTKMPAIYMPNSVGGGDLRSLEAPSTRGPGLFLGELSARKGFDLILSGASDLQALIPRLIVGGTGPLEAELRSHVHYRSGWLDYRGFLQGDDKVAAFRESAVVLLPSRRDPWPLVAVEAVIASRPLVTGPGVGSIPDLERAIPGLIHPMADMSVQSLAAATAAAVDSSPQAGPSERFTHAESAQAFVDACALALNGPSR